MTEEGPFPHLGPHQRCLTLCAIQSFERGHLQTRVEAENSA
jgi:hypothetical protein